MKFLTVRLSAGWGALIDFGRENFIAADQQVNAMTGIGKVVKAFVTGERQTPAFSDETLSARTYRAAKRGKLMGRLAMPVIDALFFWQGPNHCANAYRKEQERRNLPPEYRQNTKEPA
jgi:hypothetical protein